MFIDKSFKLCLKQFKNLKKVNYSKNFQTKFKQKATNLPVISKSKTIIKYPKIKQKAEVKLNTGSRKSTPPWSSSSSTSSYTSSSSSASDSSAY